MGLDGPLRERLSKQQPPLPSRVSTTDLETSLATKPGTGLVKQEGSLKSSSFLALSRDPSAVRLPVEQGKYVGCKNQTKKRKHTQASN